MKRSWLFIVLLVPWQEIAAQKIVNGTISLFNSKYKTGRSVFVSDVEVTGECCTTHSYSDANGFYQLIFRNLPGEAKVSATKKGMRVINEPDLRFTPQEEKENRLNIYVFDNEEWAREVKRIRTGLKKEIDKRYDSLLGKLTSENKELQTLLQNLSIQFNAPGLSAAHAKTMLEAKRMEDLYYAGKQSEDIARIHLDDAQESTVNTFQAFVKGDTKAVLSLTTNLNPDQDMEDIARFREWKTIRYILRARAAVMELRFDIADTAYRRSLLIDSLNPDVLTEYAALLQLRLESENPIFRDYDQCLPLYEKAIPLFEKLITKYPVTYAPNYARALHNAAIIYAQLYPDSDKRYQAEAWLEKSLGIIQDLANREPENFDWKLARTWTSIGRFYRERAAFSGGNQEFIDRSDSAYTNATIIYKRLATINPLDYLPELAAVIEDKAYLYADVAENRQKAAVYFKEAMQVRELLGGKGPANLQTAYLYGINSLAQAYRDDQRFKESFDLSQQHLPAAERRLRLVNRKTEKDSLGEIVSAFYRNIVISGLYTEKFKEAEAAARKLTGYDTEWSQAHLAAALLLQGKYKESEVLYRQIRTNADTRSLAIELLNELEKWNAVPLTSLDGLQNIRDLLRN